MSAPVFPPSCVGASIDLADPRVLDTCRVDDESARPTLPTTVELSTEPPSPTLRRGPDGEVVLAIRNTTSQPLTLDVDVSCGAGFTFRTEIWDRPFHRRVDLIRSGECGGGRACPVGRLLRVQLVEGGSARLPVPVRTRVVDDCTGQRLAALPAGPYGLRIRTPMGLSHDARLTLQ